MVDTAMIESWSEIAHHLDPRAVACRALVELHSTFCDLAGVAVGPGARIVATTEWSFAFAVLHTQARFLQPKSKSNINVELGLALVEFLSCFVARTAAAIIKDAGTVRLRHVRLIDVARQWSGLYRPAQMVVDDWHGLLGAWRTGACIEVDEAGTMAHAAAIILGPDGGQGER